MVVALFTAVGAFVIYWLMIYTGQHVNAGVTKPCAGCNTAINENFEHCPECGAEMHPE